MDRSVTVVVLLLLLVGGGYFLFLGESDSSNGPDGTGGLRFYVFLDGEPVTGAACEAKEAETYTATTNNGYAAIEVNIGTYTTKVTYGAHSKTKVVYVGTNGAHIEVKWVSDVPAGKGSITIQTDVDGQLVQSQVEIWQSGTKVASGLSTTKYTVDEGYYTVKARFESTQTFSGQTAVTVKEGEISYVTFSWDSGGGLVDFSIFSKTRTGQVLGLGTIIALIALIYLIFTNRFR